MGRITGCYQAARRTLCAGKFQEASLARVRCMREHAREREREGPEVERSRSWWVRGPLHLAQYQRYAPLTHHPRIRTRGGDPTASEGEERGSEPFIFSYSNWEVLEHSNGPFSSSHLSTSPSATNDRLSPDPTLLPLRKDKYTYDLNPLPLCIQL